MIMCMLKKIQKVGKPDKNAEMGGFGFGFRKSKLCFVVFIYLSKLCMHVDPFIRRKLVPDEKVVPIQSQLARIKNKELFLREITSLTWVLG